MFDSFSSSTEISNRFNYNINAVSGTIRKSHPKSKITKVPLNDTLLDKVDPKYTVKNQRYIEGNYDSPYQSEWRGHYVPDDKDYPVVILQVMLCGDGECLVEFVKKEDFDEGIEIPK